jgi:hypothetical protein
MLQLFTKHKLLIPFLLMFLFLFTEMSAGGEENKVSVRVRERVISTIDIRQATQKEEDKWLEEREKLTAAYRSRESDREYLRSVKAKTAGVLHVREREVAETLRTIREATRIREELQTYLETVVGQLEAWIKEDTVFLTEERASRVAMIKEILAQSDTPFAEKYRRVMEALQIETEYGRTVEVYQQTIALEGEPRLVDILRVGRLSLFCRTPDGTLVGTFNQKNRRWEILPSRYRNEINKATDIASRQRTIELTRVPIGRIIIP